jgi:uncharacterized protein
MLTALILSASIVAAGTPAPPPAAPGAMDALVQAYERGEISTARAGFETLSRAGVPAADYNLAVMHLRREIADAQPQEAVRLMERAASHGFVTAMLGLAKLHELGQAGLPRDLQAAHAWNLRAAEAGSPDAQVEVGTAHYLGRGAPRDRAAAAHWYREAAKRGDVGAQYLLASMYELGDGVARDLRLARYWYDIAARNGDVAAPSKLKQIDAQLREQSPD